MNDNESESYDDESRELESDPSPSPSLTQERVEALLEQPDDESPLNGATVNDTQPPPANHHGWLEQFETLNAASLEQLQEVVLGGLDEAENAILIKLAADIIGLAEFHDPEALAKVQALLNK